MHMSEIACGGLFCQEAGVCWVYGEIRMGYCQHFGVEYR